jgi:hypothetical protein
VCGGGSFPRAHSLTIRVDINKVFHSSVAPLSPEYWHFAGRPTKSATFVALDNKDKVPYLCGHLISEVINYLLGVAGEKHNIETAFTILNAIHTWT